MNYDEMYTTLKAADMLMTEVDLTLWTWQTDLDMMSFIGQDIPMRTYEPEATTAVNMTVHRVPLAVYKETKRVIIGVAELDGSSGVVRAEVDEKYGEILAIGHPAEYHIVDDVPPVHDHRAIKAQLRDLVAPGLYVNPFKIQGVTGAKVLSNIKDVMDLPHSQDGLKHLSADYIYNKLSKPIPDSDNHPFFKENN